jgi:hypothetical protein
MCGNMELQRIAPEYVPGIMSLIARMLSMPALRCEPCRHKFFSFRPVLRECPRMSAAPRDEAA